jgi:cephalosporin hydroxylase
MLDAIVESVKGAYYSLGLPLFMAAIRRASARCASLEDHVTVTERVRFRGFTIRSYQVREEIVAFLRLVERLQPARVVEIGTARGGTFYLLCKVAASTAHLVSVDLPGGGFGSGYATWKIPLFRSFAGERQRVTLLRCDSHDPTTVGLVQRAFDGAPVDVLLIDGDHEYEGVKRDFEMYRHLVRPGGVIAFHDIVPGSTRAVGGVPRFWQEVKQAWLGEVQEFVGSWTQGGYGIGVITVP